MVSICFPVMLTAACARGPVLVDAQARPQAGMGVLTGSVTRGPLSPVEGFPGRRQVEAVAGFHIVISSIDGRQVASGVTNDEGQYRINLPPGAYRIFAASLPRGGSTKQLPATVTVTEKQETRLDVRIDTGIR